MGEIIAIASQKGGVGKTATVINLGASLAIYEKKILIIDMDPQGSVAVSFQIGDTEVDKGMLQVFVNNIPLSDALIDVGFTNLHIVPSNVTSEEEEIEFYRKALNVTLLKRILNPYKNIYDYILIDCPPSIGSVTMNVLVAADSLLIPIQTEYYSLKSLGKFIKSVRNISLKYNQDLLFKGLLITMYDKRRKKSKEIVDELRYSFKNIVFNTIIPRNSKISEAPRIGKPVALYSISSQGAIGYLNLAEELLNSSINKS
jgi:chromosome partitioning protein